MEFLNVFEDKSDLYEYCKENGFTDSDYENFDELSFFEGDPDIIVLNGNVGYFAECGDKVFYWIDDCTGYAESMMETFFSNYETGVTLGGYSWITTSHPEGVKKLDSDLSWDEFEKLDAGIAYRGGAGYVYRLYDWSQWLENEIRKLSA